MAARAGQTDAILEALSVGLPITEAARRAGCSERTVSRRLAEPGFRRELNAYRDRGVAEAVGVLSSAARKAVTTLVMLCDDESPSVQLGAAKALLGALAQLRESVTLANRIATLEERLGELDEAA